MQKEEFSAEFYILHSSVCISFYGDHDVTAASRPVKAFVPVRIRLVTPSFDGPLSLGYR